MVQGFMEFGVDGEMPNLAGVVFNRIASDTHYARVKNSVRGVPVLGYLPRELNFEIPHRHLGLATAEEGPLSDENVGRLAETVLQHIDIDAIIARSALQERKPLYRDTLLSQRVLESAGTRGARSARKTGQIRIAVAYDKAFCFYYEDNLDMLRDAGAEIVRFSPLTDRAIPEGVDAVYLGGGYPELHAEALTGNSSMLSSVKAWSEAGGRLYAECGGLMYLSRGIRDFDGRFRAMAGIFPFETRMLKKPKLAYREILLNEDCMMGTGGELLRGHEFHYSEIVPDGMPERGCDRCSTVYSVRDKNGNAVHVEGFGVRDTLASYIHVHFGSNRKIAGRLARTIAG
jgi:cobyrinic acid a,c-diamide synthase